METSFDSTKPSPGKRRLAWIGLAFIVVALLVLAGTHVIFAASPSASPASGNKVVLRIGYAFEDVDNLNPFIGYALPVYEVFVQNYDFLVEHRPQDCGPGPDGIAESWESSADGKTWTFHLHKNIKWQDGVPLTADDVVFTYNYIIDNEMPAYSGPAKGIVKAVKVDDYTVKMITDKPKANILRLWIPILPKHIWSKIPPKAAATTFRNDPPVIGSGPFQVVEWKRGEYVRMEANKDYFLGAPAVDELMLIYYRNPSTMVMDLKAGRIDAAHQITVGDFARLKNTPGINAISYLLFNWDYLDYNGYARAASLGHPALRDPKFRVALDYAIDRDQLVSIAYNGRAIPGTTVLTPDCWTNPDYHWQPPAGVLRTFDPEKAKSLLDEAGYTDTNGDGLREYKGKPIRLRMWALTASTQEQAAGKLITGWFRDIGLDIRYEVVDEGFLTDRIWNYKGDTYAPDFDMYFWTWYGYDDPGQTLNAFTTSQIENWNEPCWSNAKFDRLYELQAQELDKDKRAQFVMEAQKVMYENCPESVIAYPTLLQAYNTEKWTGWLRTLNGKGPVVMTQDTQKSYLDVAPKAVAEGGKSLTWIWGIAVAAVIAGVTVVMLRRRRRPEEEA